ncbi:MAG: heparinase II/III family protein [Planctomycetota bacterium]
MAPWSLFAALALALAAAFAAGQERTKSVLTGLRPDHPRLFLDAERLAALRAAAAGDPCLAKAQDDVIARAGELLEAPPLRHQLVGPRLLSVSRACLDRAWNLALAWRLTGDPRFARAVEQNLLTVGAFPDWNPSHFLDTAEMSHAVGLGYDWCFAALEPTARETIRAALVARGLAPGIAAYTGSPPAWWTRSEFNWNQVCNGGLLVGALAIAETDPSYAEMIVAHAVESLPRALATYDPDGAWPEGPGYWSYATSYTAYALDALRTALGHDFGLGDRPGLARAGFFPLTAGGPTGLYVAYADVGEGARRGSLPVLLWLAGRYGEPALAAAEREWIAAHPAAPQHVAWYVSPAGEAPFTPPLDRLFRGPVELALLRSAADDPDALFLALKGGYNAVNHGHLDLGAFELDAGGVRWARDLGADDYNLPGYWDGQQGGKRWSYYRLGSHSHNVVTIDGEEQAVAGRARFTGFVSRPDYAHAIVEIADAWPERATAMRRGVALFRDRRAVLVQDEIELARPAEVLWGLTTDAEIEIDGPQARLVQRRESDSPAVLLATILAPPEAVFAGESAARPAPERPNDGVRRLVVRHPAAAGPLRLAVLLVPLGAGLSVLPPPFLLRPLSQW